jgi:DNA polymerase-3 subunit gamma/tau
VYLFDRFNRAALFGRVEEMNLYLKYRPKTIDELDLSLVRKALSEIVTANKTSHAYLLTGPRGAGKTSTARILARLVNCEKNGKTLAEPCNACPACLSILDGSALDVIEIDAASNRGIDDIRDLKEKIRLAPVALAKKVYIIDEVHMLTTEAFNALLKTLEEPPKHSLFILCTTETHKVPETIVSRCTRITFTKATPEEMVRSFTRVVLGEGITPEEEALLYLGSAVDGSFRDGVKVLDQIISSALPVSIASVQEILQGAAGYSATPLATALVSRDGVAALEAFRVSVSAGIDLTYLLSSTMKLLRDGLLSAYGVVDNPLPVPVPRETAELVVKLDEVARALALTSVPTLLIEMLIVQWCQPAVASSSTGSAGGGDKQPAKESTPKVAAKKVVEVSAPTEAVGAAQVSELLLDATAVWQKMLGSLASTSYGLGTLLSQAWPGTIQGNELTVYVQYDFHAQQLMSEKIRSKFEALLSTAVGQPMRVVCEIKTPELQTRVQRDTIAPDLALPSEDSLVEMAEEIFSN